MTTTNDTAKLRMANKRYSELVRKYGELDGTGIFVNQYGLEIARRIGVVS